MLHEQCAVYVDAFCFLINETSIWPKISVEKSAFLEYYYISSHLALTTTKLHLGVAIFTDVFLMHSKIYAINSRITENGWDFIRAQIMVRVIKKCSQFITQHRNKCFPICVVDKAIGEYSEIENTGCLKHTTNNQIKSEVTNECH